MNWTNEIEAWISAWDWCPPRSGQLEVGVVASFVLVGPHAKGVGRACSAGSRPSQWWRPPAGGGHTGLGSREPPSPPALPTRPFRLPTIHDMSEIISYISEASWEPNMGIYIYPRLPPPPTPVQKCLTEYPDEARPGDGDCLIPGPRHPGSRENISERENISKYENISPGSWADLASEWRPPDTLVRHLVARVENFHWARSREIIQPIRAQYLDGSGPMRGLHCAWNWLSAPPHRRTAWRRCWWCRLMLVTPENSRLSTRTAAAPSLARNDWLSGLERLVRHQLAGW